VHVAIQASQPEVHAGDNFEVYCTLVGDNAPVLWEKIDGPLANNVYVYRDLLRLVIWRLYGT